MLLAQKVLPVFLHTWQMEVDYPYKVWETGLEYSSINEKKKMIMTIKKAMLATGFALMFGMGTVAATERTEAPNAGKLGLGYQGMFAGNLLQGISGRYWVNNKVGTELNLFYGKAKLDNYDGGILTTNDNPQGDLLLATAKVLYSPVVKTQSRFYVGLEGGIGHVNLQYDDAIWNGTQRIDEVVKDSGKVYVFSPLIGSEFNLSGIPELGFNFEAGYKLHFAGPINFDYTSVSFGAHYYF